MISAVMERKPCGCSPSLLNRNAFPSPILNVEDPIAFGTTELTGWAWLGICNHFPHPRPYIFSIPGAPRGRAQAAIGSASSSHGLGIVEGGSLAGKESANVVSIFRSR